MKKSDKDKKEIDAIIEMLSLRKKQFVKCPRNLMPKLMDELDNYPNAKIKFFGVSGGVFNVIRDSSSKYLKKENKVTYDE